MSELDKCNRCGKCCFLKGIKEGQCYISDIPCRFLKVLKNGKTKCSIWKKPYRLGIWCGTIDGLKNICIKRIDSEWEYENCLYNEDVTKKLEKDYQESNLKDKVLLKK